MSCGKDETVNSNETVGLLKMDDIKYFVMSPCLPYKESLSLRGYDSCFEWNF